MVETKNKKSENKLRPALQWVWHDSVIPMEIEQRKEYYTEHTL